VAGRPTAGARHQREQAQLQARGSGSGRAWRGLASGSGRQAGLARLQARETGPKYF